MLEDYYLIEVKKLNSLESSIDMARLEIIKCIKG